VRRRELVWAATVGVVLADSSVVTLALPEMLRELDTSVIAVSWVLTSFNVVLALAVLPAAYLVAVRGGPERVCVGGVLVFGVASLVCAVAPGLGLLLAGRCLQALGGAFVIAGVWLYQIVFLCNYRAGRAVAHIKEQLELARWRIAA